MTTIQRKTLPVTVTVIVEFHKKLRTIARLMNSLKNRRGRMEMIPPKKKRIRMAIMEMAQKAETKTLNLLGTELTKVLSPMMLAEILAIEPGATVDIEVLEGSRPVRKAIVAGVVRQYIGIGAYMTLENLNRLMHEGNAVSGAYLAIDAVQRDAIYAEMKKTPRVAAVEASDARVQNFYDTIAEFLLTYMGFISALAGAIVFGIVYNSARIALAERSRELASLRVLGFTRTEVSYILLGELALLTLLAIPPGFVIGQLLSAWMVATLPHEFFRVPLVLARDTYALAAMVVITAAVLSSLIVRRRIDRFDLVAVLKTRE